MDRITILKAKVYDLILARIRIERQIQALEQEVAKESQAEQKGQPE